MPAIRSLYVVVCVCYLLAWPCMGQTAPTKPRTDVERVVDGELHEFFDRNGRVVAVGSIIGLTSDSVAFVDGLDKRYKTKISNLSKPDQVYCRNIYKQLTVIKRSKQTAKRLIEQLDASSERTQVKACQQLRKMGIGATETLPKLKEVISTAEGEELLAEAFLAYVAICDTTPENLDYVLSRVSKGGGPLGIAILRNPGPFLDSVSRWGEASLSYLQYVAYTGDVSWKEKKQLTATKTPMMLATTKDIRNRNRSLACLALGNILVKSTPILVATLKSAENVVNNQRDEGTIVAALTGLGKAGFRPTDVVAAIARHKTKYPRVIAQMEKVIAAQTKIRNAQALLSNGSRMKYYNDTNGEPFFRGRVLSADRVNAIFYDREMQKVAIPLAKFSKEDATAIRDQFSK